MEIKETQEASFQGDPRNYSNTRERMLKSPTKKFSFLDGKVVPRLALQAEFYLYLTNLDSSNTSPLKKSEHEGGFRGLCHSHQGYKHTQRDPCRPHMLWLRSNGCSVVRLHARNGKAPYKSWCGVLRAAGAPIGILEVPWALHSC